VRNDVKSAFDLQSRSLVTFIAVNRTIDHGIPRARLYPLTQYNRRVIIPLFAEKLNGQYIRVAGVLANDCHSVR
jgi:hypothetical protein